MKEFSSIVFPPPMDIKANLHITLKLEMLKVKVKDKGRN